MNDIPAPQAAMQFIGEDPTGRKWYFADNSFSKPGIYFRDGANNIHVQELIEHQARELTTAREQLLESESARNRNFQSASVALKTVAKLSAKLETCTLQTEQYSRIMLKALAELSNKTANLAHADTKIGELQDFIKTQSAELAKVKEEYDGLVDLANKQAFAEGIRLGDALRECDMLRAENAAKDAALQQWIAGNAHAEREEWEAASAHYHEADRLAIIALSTTPPVCVPVEVVAKLVEALEAMHRGSLQNGNTRESSDIIWTGHKASKEARALAAPFLAKGESKV